MKTGQRQAIIFTEGPVIGKLVLFAVPILLSELLLIYTLLILKRLWREAEEDGAEAKKSASA